MLALGNALHERASATAGVSRACAGFSTTPAEVPPATGTATGSTGSTLARASVMFVVVRPTCLAHPGPANCLCLASAPGSCGAAPH